jgi:2-dehydropantoate 2-reductase
VRFVVYGAGAVGGVVGARLFQAGHDVTLVARGEHAQAIARSGLRLESPDGVESLPIPVVESQALSGLGSPSVVLLAVKSQDTAHAIRDLAAAGAAEAVVCLQNGVDNERVALRCFDHVYGICVMLPAAHLEPGVVTSHASPVAGILDIGRYPEGIDERAVGIAAALTGATFISEPRADIMRWKYRKLVMNLGNAVQALCGRVAEGDAILELVNQEAMRCFEAAGINPVTVDEDRVRRADHIQRRPVHGRPRTGGSSYQSLERAQGTIETDYLNGEICLLGRTYGVPTPANAVVQRLANRAAAEHWEPGRMTAAELLEAVTGEGPV